MVSHLFVADASLLFFSASISDCRAVKDIMNIYSRAFGQDINLDKSRFVASKNTQLNQISRISNILQVRVGNSPSQNKHDKNLLFHNIKNRVWKTLQGWKQKLFLVERNEVFIKAVAQAILVYTLSTFKLPRSLCNDINSICANFWWGSKFGKMKIHSKNWESLSTSKKNVF